MKPFVRCIVFILPLIALLAGCGTRNPYDVMERQAGEDTIPLKAVVTEFEDARPHESHYNQTFTMIPLVPYGGYSLDRHDSIYSSATEPFPEMAAKRLTERLDEMDVFEDVTYYSPNQLPEPGAYDVLVKGRLNSMQSKGGISRYGLSFIGDLFWELGAPNRSRRWVIDIDYWLVDAYDGDRITEPINAELETSRSIYTKYYNIGRVDDLTEKSTPAYDAFIADLWNNKPPADDPKWVAVRTEGQDLLEAQAREQARIRQGSPPTFSFLAPAEGSVVREARVPVRWSIAAPMHLKTAALVANGEPVSLPIDKLALANDETAPLSIPAREITAPLEMGDNQLEALVTDHRGNESRASLNITRLPRKLDPERRYALLIGTGSAEAQQSVQSLKTVLANPLIGQFDAADITTVTGSELNGSEIQNTVSSFGRKPLADDLVIVYFATNGNWDSFTIGDGATTLDELVQSMERSLATEKVIFLEDINWTGSGGQSVNQRLQNLPRQWAYITPNAEGGDRESRGETTLFTSVIVNVLRGENGETSRLTLERFIDRVLDTLARSGADSPDKYGYYSPNITLAERE